MVAPGSQQGNIRVQAGRKASQVFCQPSLSFRTPLPGNGRSGRSEASSWPCWRGLVERQQQRRLRLVTGPSQLALQFLDALACKL